MINPLYLGHVYPALPTSFTDSLSYLEELGRVAKKLNEVIEELNSIDPDTLKSEISVFVESEIDEYMETVNKQMDNLSSQMSTIMGGVNTALENYETRVMLEVNSKISELTSFVNSQITAIKMYIDSQDNAVMAELRYQINLLKNSLPEMTTVYVKSPYTGLTITIQDAVNELWLYIRFLSLTAYEYDSLKLTAEKYDSYELTAYLYDFQAKNYIWRNPDLFMFHPWTGEYVETKEVVAFLATIVKQLNLTDIYPPNSNHAITAELYDSLKLSIPNFAVNIRSCQEYDWNATTKLKTFIDRLPAEG